MRERKSDDSEASIASSSLKGAPVAGSSKSVSTLLHYRNSCPPSMEAQPSSPLCSVELAGTVVSVYAQDAVGAGDQAVEIDRIAA